MDENVYSDVVATVGATVGSVVGCSAMLGRIVGTTVDKLDSAAGESFSGDWVACILVLKVALLGSNISVFSLP